MKIKLTSLFILALSASVLAQTAPAKSDTAWKKGGNIELLFNQAAYTNWQAGGVNSLASNGQVFLFANYDNGGDWTWYNKLNIGYGINLQDGLYSKTDDRFEFESRADRAISDHWNVSGLVNFRTQFSDGFRNAGETADSLKISAFMSPGYLIAGLGITYKPNGNFSLYISPVTSKQTYVLDEKLSNEGAFGVDTGSSFRQEIGGYLNMKYGRDIFENVAFNLSLDLYSNYLDGNYEFIDVNGEAKLLMKINKFMTANFTFAVMYDHDIIFDTSDGGTMRRTQFKQILGVGLTHSFGAKAAQ